MSIKPYLKAFQYDSRRADLKQNWLDFKNYMNQYQGTLDDYRDEGAKKAYARIMGRGAYGVRKFGRDFKQIVPKSVRRKLEDSLSEGMSGSGLYSGRGAYSGRGSYNNLISGGRPSMMIDSDGDETQSMTISHTEYLQDVFGAPSANFSVESWQLNPGLVENFPWLAQICANYEEYEFVQLLFHYKSTVDASAINNTNGSTGTLIMATNYNPTAPNFANKETMMQYHGANSSRVVDDMSHGIECDPEKNAGTGQKYVRTMPVVTNQDLKTFDLGKFQLAQVNLPSAFFNQQIGELWVTYTVKMTKPRLYNSIGGNIMESRYLSTGSETWNGWFGLTGTTSPSVWYTPTNMVTMQQSNIPCNIQLMYTNGSASVKWGSNIRITLPDFITGVFEVQLFCETTTATTNPDGATCSFSGSVKAWADIGALSPAGDDFQSGSYFQTTLQRLLLQRFEVAPITAGVDNTVTIAITYPANAATPTDAITQVQLIIRQVNPYLGQNQQNPVPAYVNSFGTQVQV